MRKTAALAGAVLTVLLLMSGCTGNLFMQLDQPEVPSSSELNDKASTDPEGFISDVEDYLDGGAIDDSNAGDVNTALKDNIYDPSTGTPPSGEQEQKAALLIGEVAIAGNDNAGKVVDNVPGVLSSIDDGTSSDPEAFIRELLPAGLSSTEFNAMVAALVEAGEAYLDFGESLDQDLDGTLEEVPFMSSADIGDTLNRAAAGIALIAALDAMDGTVDGTYSTSYSSDLQNIVEGASYSGPDPTTAFDGSLTDYDGAQNLLELAGFDVS
ncbi:MAG: hypothetical protein SVR04_03570 [Spirochaetota bacterium]|nr:hypothetical protein [Spirochaetota bacterium]